MGGEIADWYAVDNWEKLQRMQQTQMKMAELRERAATIEHTTGNPPLGFFAFEKAYPTPTERTKNGLVGGALIGGMLGGLLGGLFTRSRGAEHAGEIVGASLVGGTLGAIIGKNTKEQEDSRVLRALTKYETYIQTLEIQAQAHALTQPALPHPVLKTTHAKDVLESRATTQESGLQV